MTAVLGFIPSWAWRWLAFGLLIAAAAGFCWMKGNEHGAQKLLDYKAAQAIATVKLTAAREKVVTQIQVKYVDRIKTIYQQGDTITKEIPIYVNKTDDAGCTIPTGFVRVYGSAWSGTPPGTPGESDRQPSGVPLSEIASDDTNNATSCRVYKEERDGLIEFYNKLRTTNGNP